MFKRFRRTQSEKSIMVLCIVCPMLLRRTDTRGSKYVGYALHTLYKIRACAWAYTSETDVCTF